MGYQQERRAKFAAQGLCVGCGKCEPKVGRKRCQTCLDKVAVHTTKYLIKKAMPETGGIIHPVDLKNLPEYTPPPRGNIVVMPNGSFRELKKGEEAPEGSIVIGPNGYEI